MLPVKIHTDARMYVCMLLCVCIGKLLHTQTQLTTPAFGCILIHLFVAHRLLSLRSGLANVLRCKVLSVEGFMRTTQ